MDGFAGSSQKFAVSVSNSLTGRLNALKDVALDLDGDGFMALWDALTKVARWARDNGSCLGPLAGGIRAMAGVIGGVVLTTKAWTTALTIYKGLVALAKGQTILFNTALLANPLTWIAALIVGLNAGLTLFFMKTETG